MKVRFGFVSNSSSSSFCIYGACIDDEDLDTYECVDKYLEDNGVNLTFVRDVESGFVYLGLPPQSIQYDETALQFQIRVKDELKKINVTDKFYDIGWVCETLYNM